ncbi:3-methyl-2-oxobutanoate hydroxymethyltransferase [Mobiluncus curtisii]|uniref:3-methyl-2-oxobutanoate hydroxymethyltransferase n=1 Tax=Mobiluncus curtisii TaxID=2051 RepID=A0A2X3BLW6_9ACTO|nr:3-methyl-2-oxobutanoate hydroxymethyltransferase [Mobiluncus curtisii]SQC01643.1 3-methyl-2-oxobutanoate hydroxymethyltransferase [Mobiluncus curtisii]
MLVRAGAAAVKLEGGRRILPQVKAIVNAGINVMGHLGFTPQSENHLGGKRLQGRSDAAPELIAGRTGLARRGSVLDCL